MLLSEWLFYIYILLLLLLLIAKRCPRFFSSAPNTGLLAVAKMVINPASYFAQELHASMKGLGTDNGALIRILVSRSEVRCAAVVGTLLLLSCCCPS